MQLSSGNKIIAAIVVLLLIDYTIVALRCYSRRLRGSRWALDDWLVAVALVPLTSLTFLLIYAFASGTLKTDAPHDGPGIPYFTDQGIAGAKIAYAFQMIEGPTLSALKLSVLLLYRRIFSTKRFKMFNNVMIAVVLLWALAAIFLNLFDCGIYIDANYSRSVGYMNEKCGVDFYTLGFYMLSDIVVDILILLQPVPMVWNLHMGRSQRIATVATFFTGFLAVLATITRMVMYDVANKTFLRSSQGYRNEIEFFSVATTFTIVEIDVAVFAACLPTLKPVMTLAMSHFRHLTQSKRNSRATRLSSVSDSEPSSQSMILRGQHSYVGIPSDESPPRTNSSLKHEPPNDTYPSDVVGLPEIPHLEDIELGVPK